MAENRRQLSQFLPVLSNRRTGAIQGVYYVRELQAAEWSVPRGGLAPARSSLRPAWGQASAGSGPIAAPLAPIVMAHSEFRSPFCSPQEDPFLLLESTKSAIESILRAHAGRPLRRTWIEHPYGEEEICLLEEEVLPAIERCMARIEEIDQAIESEQLTQEVEQEGREQQEAQAAFHYWEAVRAEAGSAGMGY